MLAQLLEALLDTKAYSSRLKTLVIMALAIMFFAVVFVTGKEPTHSEDTSAAQALVYRGIVQRKGPDIRSQSQVWVSTRIGVEEAGQLKSFYKEPELSELVLNAPNQPFPYSKARSIELPVQAQIGDSVVKKVGELTAHVIHGDSVYVFRYKCPWHGSLL